ncbi:hypothetical protein [Microbispora sp. H10949]|uniref:hypothetical protein n=1 Tax=Microbispora sp. H10949 TaxID=2729111 RepID=UPI0016025328|nr:hypothetical protein [Microbispora sp. H10949]
MHDQPDVDPRILDAENRLAERTGREKVASVIQQLIDGYAWQAWLKERGVTLPDKVGIRINLGYEPDEETIALVAELGNALLIVSMESAVRDKADEE